jgi:hypothetical protein
LWNVRITGDFADRPMRDGRLGQIVEDARDLASSIGSMRPLYDSKESRNHGNEIVNGDFGLTKSALK